MSEPVVPPIVASSTFRFRSNDEVLRAVGGEGHLYSRWDNPTVQAAEEELRKLMRAEGALCFGSGMAAVSCVLLTALRERKRLLCQEQVYGGTYQLARDFLPRLGFEVSFFPVDGWREAFASAPDDVGVVYVETPTNPTLRLVDLDAIGEATRLLGAKLVVDNTFATPVLQSPLALGADIELHSATKYLGGHSDLIAGCAAGTADFMDELWSTRKLLGAVLDPFQAFLLHRGLKTLELRVTRQSETALGLAAWLESQPEVRRVHYPGLASHPEHALACRQMRAFGGMLAFEVAGGDAAARRLSEALEVVHLAPSLGGTETLITLPSTTTHVNLTEEERLASGLPPGLVRLSVGLEDPQLLRDDLALGLEVATG
ncbi:MAG: PLP-dependent aspartate aminotransferase family protein [Planctomycetota bacterium]